MNTDVSDARNSQIQCLN